LKHVSHTIFTISLALIASAIAYGDQPSITIYNQRFGEVKQTIPLNLKAGINHITDDDVTSYIEPSSVVLRDPNGESNMRVLEQNYRADDLTATQLLSKYVGQTIDFQVKHGSHTEIVSGKVIRGGSVPLYIDGVPQRGYFNPYQETGNSAPGQPIIEVDGKLQFKLPGIPLFPGIPDDAILKPSLDWQIQSDTAGPLNAELSYITGGMQWAADYVLVSHDNGTLDLVGNVTLANDTGKSFDNAQIKLIAGDLNKSPIKEPYVEYSANLPASPMQNGDAPPVAEKTFDDYHMYTLKNRTTLHGHETKQVEFIRAQDIPAERIYIFDGSQDSNRYVNWGFQGTILHAQYGTTANTKVAVFQRLTNSGANHLGIPLPRGTVRMYRQMGDGRPSKTPSRVNSDNLQYIGRDFIDHMPKDESLLLYLGDAFDIVGQRRQVNILLNGQMKPKYDIDGESFEIKLRNHKKTSVDVHVLEHVPEWQHWEITAKSQLFRQMNANTIEFLAHLEPNEERTITYTVRYP